MFVCNRLLLLVFDTFQYEHLSRDKNYYQMSSFLSNLCSWLEIQNLERDLTNSFKFIFDL